MDLSITCLYYTGFWPPPPWVGRPRAILRAWRLIFPRLQLARMAYGLIAQAFNIYLDWGAVSNGLEYLTVLMTQVKLLSCLYILVFRHAELAAVVGYLRTKQAMMGGEGQTEGQRRILARTNKFTHFMTLVILVGMASCHMLVGLVWFAHGLYHREIPFRKWFPYDTTSSPFFEATLSTVMVTQTMDLNVLLVFDLLFFAVFFQLFGQFSVLNYRLAHMRDLACAEVREELKRRNDVVSLIPSADGVTVISVGDRGEASQRLNLRDHTSGTGGRSRFRPAVVDVELSAARFLHDCVEHHIELVKISESVNSLLQSPLQYQVVSNGIICLAVIYITKLSLSVDFKIAVEAGVILVVTIEFFVYCVLGTLLLEYSEQVRYSAYSGGWPAVACKSSKVRSALLLLMAQRGVCVKAFAVLPVTVETFVTVLKFSYSMYTVAVPELLVSKATRGDLLP